MKRKWDTWKGRYCMEAFRAANFAVFPHRGDKKYAIVMGNEVKGVQQEVVNACDGCIEIPQYGTKHSLNVSVTTGIIVWEFANKLMKFR